MQQKLALPAACVVVALAGVVIALRARRGGAALVVGASGAVFGTYDVVLVAGESLADGMVVLPVVRASGANVLLPAVALLAWRWRRPPRQTGDGTAVVAHG